VHALLLFFFSRDTRVGNLFPVHLSPCGSRQTFLCTEVRSTLACSRTLAIDLGPIPFSCGFTGLSHPDPFPGPVPQLCIQPASRTRPQFRSNPLTKLQYPSLVQQDEVKATAAARTSLTEGPKAFPQGDGSFPHKECLRPTCPKFPVFSADASSLPFADSVPGRGITNFSNLPSFFKLEIPFFSWYEWRALLGFVILVAGQACFCNP